MISGRTWTRRCRACLHTASRRLPELSKRVIYLDQMVFSNIAKAVETAAETAARVWGK
jgi:hypothetical protein